MTSNSSKIPYLPEPLQGLGAIALNFSWRWNRLAREVFWEIDPTLYQLSGRNPIELLRRADPARLAALARDPQFLEKYRRVMEVAALEETTSGTWFAQNFGVAQGEEGKGGERASGETGTEANPIAYFCAEFGIHKSVPIYSGGLGVLAGDHCKAASDLGVPLVGVGLLYLKGYFDQTLSLDGWQADSQEQFDPLLTPLEPLLTPDGDRSLATVTLFGREIHVGAWRMVVGRTSIILLDSNLPENQPEDQDLTQKLYQGGDENRLCQEWILGVGGVRVLRAIGINPSAWHANEGHAAFMMVERVREYLEEGVDLEEAVATVRANGVFTTHTPVPAGHDTFTTEQIDQALHHYWETTGIDRETFLAFGTPPEKTPNTFHMTACAMRLSRYVNGVAEKHGQVTRENWTGLWPGREPNEVPIFHITNGVHLSSWMAWRMMDLLDDHLGSGWAARIEDEDLWKSVLEIDDHALCVAHRRLKRNLLSFIREQARKRWRDEWEEANHLVGAGTLLDPSALTLGFARRFATYKRADLIFRDEERLLKLLTNPWRPVQIIFAGKAHPADDAGKRMLQRVYSYTRDPRFEGRIAFLQDYDLNSADRLVQGVDLWLNLPVVPMEASGTSGMKAALNAVPQVSTLDGWWAEGYTGLNGWALPVSTGYPDPDAADAENLYSLLEREVVPLFYSGEKEGQSEEWVLRMKHALYIGGARFTASRMLREYTERCYIPSIGRSVEGDDPPVTG
ncbi:MAG: alpha-glucan family phosphorylase [Gemmatimonadetes bacterium]|nr:alpha-glucan family phosphorylase [Gemmatimonadota bacterium]